MTFLPPAQTISFCALASGPPARVRVLLELVRPHVQEVVLAVDRRAGTAILDRCSDLADQCLSVEVGQSPDPVFGWLAHQCRGDWVLRLDDDEVPSTALLDALPGLANDRHLTHCWLPRRWLFPDGDHYISSFPWSQDPQPRLFRNIPGTWEFSGRLHDAGSFLGEGRLLDLPIYHADLILNSAPARVRKAARYDAIRDDLFIDVAPCTSLYLPEQWSDVAVGPVDDADRAALSRLVDPPLASGGDAGATMRLAQRDEVDLRNDSWSESEDLYRATIAFEHGPAQVTTETIRHWQVRVTNQGDTRWPPGEHRHPAVRLGSHWVGASTGEQEPAEQARAFFTESVYPAQSTRMWLGAQAPARPGHYYLEADLVHEGVRWFGLPARQLVTVTPPGAPPRESVGVGSTGAASPASDSRQVPGVV